MWRLCAIVGVTLALVAGSAGARAPSLTRDVPFAVPGATEVKVAKLGAREWRISYHAPGTWYVAVLAQLERAGWESASPTAYAPLSRSYLRARGFGVCDVLEWVFVSFDPGNPQNAQIRVRRVVVFPWSQRLSRFSRMLSEDMLRSLDNLHSRTPEQLGQLRQAPDMKRGHRPLQ